MIEEHRHVVEALRDALLERHELVGAEILDVVDAAVVDVRTPVVRPTGRA